MLVAAALLFAQTAPVCAAMDAALPVQLSGWTASGGSFQAGAAVALTAVDASTLEGLPKGAKPGPAAMIAFQALESGVYGIALDQPGWIDVRAGGWDNELLKSVAHGHGPECSTIRKIVRFRLEKHGDYRIYVTGLTKPRAKVMLVKE